MADGDPIEKTYSDEGALVPQFDVTPEVGLAALDVEFTDEQFLPSGSIENDYTSGVGLDDIEKVYV